MNKELQKRIKLLNCRANAFIICLGIAAVFLLLGGVCVSDSESRIFGLILLAIAGVNIVIFVYVILAAKMMQKHLKQGRVFCVRIQVLNMTISSKNSKIYQKKENG